MNTNETLRTTHVHSMAKVQLQQLNPNVIEVVLYQESYTLGEIICQELEKCSDVARVAYRQNKQNVAEEKRNLFFTVAFKEEVDISKAREIIKQCLRNWLSRVLLPAKVEFQENVAHLKGKTTV